MDNKFYIINRLSEDVTVDLVVDEKGSGFTNLDVYEGAAAVIWVNDNNEICYRFKGYE